MRPPVLSVVIAAYNAEPYLEAALGSLLRQGVDGLEVIAVNDGSTDGTAQVFARHPQARIINQPNLGPVAARNAALPEARGEYLMFLDADDLLPPGVLQSQLRVLRGGADWVVCRNILFEDVDHAGAPIPCGEWKLFGADLDVHLCHFNIAPLHAFMFRREAVSGLRFDLAPPLGEDYGYWFSMLRRGLAPQPNHEAWVAYRRHSGSLSANLERLHRSDAQMHLRVAEALRADPRFPAGGEYEARLACRAGCLCTAARLRREGDGEYPGVLEHAAQTLENSLTGLRPGRADTLRLYFEQRLVRLGAGEIL